MPGPANNGAASRLRVCSDIVVENPRHVSRGVTLAELDGKPWISRDNIVLVNDGEHHIRVVLG
jgi:hypothetical protein